MLLPTPTRIFIFLLPPSAPHFPPFPSLLSALTEEGNYKTHYRGRASRAGITAEARMAGLAATSGNVAGCNRRLGGDKGAESKRPYRPRAKGPINTVDQHGPVKPSSGVDACELPSAILGKCASTGTGSSRPHRAVLPSEMEPSHVE